MAPLVTNSEDPDGTESEKENETLKVPAPSETTVNNQNQLESGAPSTDQVSFQSESPTESLSQLSSDTAEKQVTETTADIVAPAQVTFIHPWDGPPAQEPVYPPGTYRGMF